MISLLRRISTRDNSILLLILISLVCLPIALRKFVSDAALSLLLPVTILSGLLAFGLGGSSIKNIWALLVLILFGPLTLFIRIAQVGGALFSTILESLLITSNIVLSSQGSTNISLDFSKMLSAGDRLLGQSGGFGYRLFVWLSGIAQNKPVGDLAARAFVWGLVLWLMAAWASWQIRRNGKTLAGLTPATLILGLILYNTNPHSGILWLYLVALILLVGITNFENLVTPWRRRGTDYSDSIWEDTLIATFALTLGLIVTGYLISSFSIKEILDRMRERQTVRTSSSTETVSTAGVNVQVQASIPASHPILGGPTLSQDVVMLIRTGDFPPMPHAISLDVPYYHWRSLTYQTYTGSGWTNPTSTNEEIPPHQMLIQDTPENYRIVHQVVTFPSDVDAALYWTGTLVQSDTPLLVTWRSQSVGNPSSAGFDPLSGADMVGGLISETAAGSTLKYTAESILPNESEANLRAATAAYPAWISQGYLSLPDTVPERVRALARDLTANAPTPYDQAIAIESYLRQIPYSLDVPAPPPNQDAADYFLFDLKKGYCDYYATAMTVMARAVGLPARLVLGYASGTYDPYTAQYVVRQADAHAWPEIYFSGIGWIEFEPTASQPAISRFGNNSPLPQPVTEPQGQETWDQIALVFMNRFDFAWKPLIALLLLYLSWIGTDGLRLSFRAPSDAIQRLFKRLRALARPMSGDPAPDETANEYAAILIDRLVTLQNRNRIVKWLLSPVQAQVSSLTDLYTRCLFSPVPLTRADIRNAVQTWSRLRWRLFLMNLFQMSGTRFLTR